MTTLTHKDIDRIETIAWDYFRENDLIKERDVEVPYVGTRAEQYLDEDMLA